MLVMSHQIPLRNMLMALIQQKNHMPHKWVSDLVKVYRCPHTIATYKLCKIIDCQWLASPCYNAANVRATRKQQRSHAPDRAIVARAG